MWRITFNSATLSLALLLVLQRPQLASSDTGLDRPFTSSFATLSHAPCVTLFHRNGRLGCGTEDRSNQIGMLKYFDGSLPNMNEPWVAVIEDYKLTANNMDTLLAVRGGFLQGILVLNSTAEDGSSEGQHTYNSPDSQTPRGYGTPDQYLSYGYSQYKWNANGQNLFSYDLFGIPMAFVTESDVSDSLREDSQSDTADNSIVAEFNYYMGMDKMDSKQCLAWEDVATGQWAPKCLPLGGTSVWATCGTPPNPSKDNGYKRPVVVVGAGMDSTSMFHDVSPGANTAASNILTLVMAARLLGENLDDAAFDSLSNRIVFALFQGESYGFVGSRSFLKDLRYPGFQCYSSPVHAVTRLGDKSEYACLNPVRPSLQFANLGKISGMISVDQIGHEVGDGMLYVHADQNNDSFGSFLANILINSGTNYFSVAQASTENNGNGYPYPPTPLTSLLSLSQGNVGGAVLTGYDYAFTNKVPYHSHMDSATHQGIGLKSVAAAATIVARSALAAAYDSGDYDYETAAAYAANLIPELDYQDEFLQELAHCLFYDGLCDLIRRYSSVEMANAHVHTGLNLGSGLPMSTPPSYYVGVYNGYYGQPFVQVGDNIYGSYDGNDYGSRNTDAVGMIPNQLESAIHGMLNDFLGRGTVSSNSDDDGDQFHGKECSKLNDCADVDYCSSYGESPTCTAGGWCVCTRAHYHVAFDEAIYPVPGKPTGYFKVKDGESGYSPIYTEPFWSNNVGVGVYRDVGWLPGFFTLVAGIAAGSISLFGAFVLRVGLKKEKLY